MLFLASQHFDVDRHARVQVNMVLVPVAAYNVDIMRSQSSQLMSAHRYARRIGANSFGTLLTSFTQWCAKHIHLSRDYRRDTVNNDDWRVAYVLDCCWNHIYRFWVGQFDNKFGGALTSLLRFLCATIKYGDRMRAWVNVGYSTAENN